MPAPLIRPEQAADHSAIRALTLAAFAPEAHSSHTEHLIIDALRRSGQLTVALVAERGGQVVGYVAISPVTVSSGAGGWYGLGPVAVAPAHQQQGLGTHLVREALAQLHRQPGAVGCVVLGEPAYYGRFGFRAVPGLVLPGVPAAYFQALSFAGLPPTGTVSYHASFEATA